MNASKSYAPLYLYPSPHVSSHEVSSLICFLSASVISASRARGRNTNPASYLFDWGVQNSAT